MSLRIVVDMNLSAEWIPLLEQAGWHTVHWSAVGDPRADDAKGPVARVGGDDR
jgi:predicted nuclease of predicted toxin-antitoxin system